MSEEEVAQMGNAVENWELRSRQRQEAEQAKARRHGDERGIAVTTVKNTHIS